jgi:hypothetical protein
MHSLPSEMIMKKIGIVGALICLASCSPVMEATRPDPVDLNQFVIGETRINVVSVLGSPVATVPDKDNSCDVYKLYIHGPDGAGKGVIAAGEAVGDVLTLGLAEVIFTPVEAGTSAEKHAVVFCYDKDNKLVSMNQSDSSTGGGNH